MAIAKILSRDKASYAFSRFDKPMLEGEPGETVVVETEDAVGGVFRSAEDIRAERFSLLSLAGHVRLGSWLTAYCILPKSCLRR